MNRSNKIAQEDQQSRSRTYRFLSTILFKDEPTVEEKKECEPRATWGSKVEFILSALGYAVGLGNVWRFPWMTWKNGGGAFLIPYFTMLVLAGLPIFFMEVSLGQYGGVGPNKLFELAPLFKGLGMGVMLISFFSSLYYNVIIMWSLYYLFSAFTKNLPWKGCDNYWNTIFCYDNDLAKACEKNDTGSGLEETGAIYMYKQCFNSSLVNEGLRYIEYGNRTLNETKYQLYTDRSVPAAQEFFNQKMYQLNYPGTNDNPVQRPMEDVGPAKWDITLTLLASWVIVYLCVLKGIKTSGKVVYFTALFPYAVLIILLGFGASLDGARQGVEFYLIPDWSKLKEPQIWADAAGQIFFSLSVGMGGLMTYASYNEYNNNILRDTLIVSIGNCATSIFAGFPIFCTLGYLAKTLGKEVKDVVDSGSALAFVVYPEVTTKMPISQLWAVLFFFMLITLGLDSQFAGIEVILTAVIDSRPKLTKWKPLVSGIICTFMFLITITMVTDAGIYWEELVSYYSGWSLVLVGFAEAVIFAWAYGANNILDNLEDMLGFKFTTAGKWYWWVIWKFVTPILLFAIMIFNFIDTAPISYGKYVLPPWAQAIGWLCAIIPIILIPIFAVLVVIFDKMDKPNTGETLGQRLIRLMGPSDKWVSSKERYGTVDKEDNVENGNEETNNAYIESTDAYLDKQNETGM